MILVVISYPGHYHITQLAIKQAMKYIDGVTAVYVIWDDRDIPAPSDYIPMSLVIKIPPHIKGWYKQQIVKLNLHNVFPNEKMVVLDGDVILHSAKQPNKYFYAPLLGPEISNYSLVKEALQIEQFDFLATRFMYVESQWLAKIQTLNPNLNQLYQNIAMSNWSLNGRWPLSEWEIIYNYTNNVLCLNKCIKPFEYQLLKTNEFESKFNISTDLVLDGQDNLSKAFYQQNGININSQIWSFAYNQVD